MKKSELITKVAVDAEISKAKAEAEVNSLINSVTEELKAGGAVALTGFGTFQVKERAARTGRTPKLVRTSRSGGQNPRIQSWKNAERFDEVTVKPAKGRLSLIQPQ